MDIDLTHRIERVAELPGHEERAWHVAWNPEKPLIASCSSDKTIRMWTYRSLPSDASLHFEPTTTVSSGHTKTVRALAWSPSGKTLATASFDANIGIWEREHGDDGQPSQDWECTTVLEGHETECKSVAYSCTGTLLASCSRDKTVWIWEVHPDADFECISVLMEHSQDVKSVSWHPTEEILASASYDDTIKLYKDDPSDDWYCSATLTGHASTVWATAWAPSGNYLASASADKTVRVWKSVSEDRWECVLVLEGSEREVYSVTWGPGKPREGSSSLGWIASAGSDGVIRIWELEEATEEQPSKAKAPSHRLIAQYADAHGVQDINTIVWCPRQDFNDLLATAGDDGFVRVWRVTSQA